MRRFLAVALLSFLILAAVAGAQNNLQQGINAVARQGGTFYAASYGTWTARIISGNTTTGSGTSIVVTAPTPLSDGSNPGPGILFNPTMLAPITVNDNNNETVTPTSITLAACPAGNLGIGQGSGYCATITGTFNNTHGQSAIVQSGTFGLAEAISAAALTAGTQGTATPWGGTVILDNGWTGSGGLTSTITGLTPVYGTVTIEDLRGPSPSWWTPQPSALTALATPAVRVAAVTCTALANAVCDAVGVVGTWTNAATYVCVTYVDIQGQQSPCSATANYTTAGSLAIQFNSPAASTGAVGWKAFAGITGYTTAYELPVSATTCTLTTLEVITPACAMGAVGKFPTPTTTTQLHPGYVVNTYNPNELSHTTFAYAESAKAPSICAPESNFGPFLVNAGGTTTQVEVVGSVELAPGCLNQITRSIRITGKINDVAGSGETPKITVMLGPTFTTGTPTAICTMVGTTTTGAGVTTNDAFTCIMNTNATGATGTVQPNGTMIVSNTAGTVTASTISVDTGVAAVTGESLIGRDTLYIVYTPTSATNTSAQLLDLHIEDL